MKIGIDLDDTITDSYDLITDSYFFCCNVDKEKYLKYKLSYYDFEKVFPNYKDFTIKSFSKIIPHVKVKKDAKEVINALHNMGYTIEIVTARNNTEYEDPYKITYDYLKKHNIYFDKINVNVSNKGLFCKTNNIDILIDDSIVNLNSASDHGIKTIMYNNIFNENNHNFFRVNSWQDILNIFSTKIKED